MSKILVFAGNPDQYNKFIQSEKYREDGYRVNLMLFATKRSVKGLSNCKCIFLDGWELNDEYNKEALPIFLPVLQDLEQRFMLKWFANAQEDKDNKIKYGS